MMGPLADEADETDGADHADRAGGDARTPSGRRASSLLVEGVVPLSEITGRDLADRAMVFKTEMGEVVLCCPVTKVPLTRPMAEASGLDHDALDDMLAGRVPLGMNAGKWDRALEVIEAGLSPARSFELARDDVRLAVGGPSIRCFCLNRTALENKRFPQDPIDLRLQIASSSRHRGKEFYRVDEYVQEALAVYESLELRRPPRFPWYGIMAALHLEDPPEVEIKMSGELIDRTMCDRGETDPGIHRRRQLDRLNRWHAEDVYDAFPGLAVLRLELVELGGSVKIEFFGVRDAQAMAERFGWWPLAKQDPID